MSMLRSPSMSLTRIMRVSVSLISTMCLSIRIIHSIIRLCSIRSRLCHRIIINICMKNTIAITISWCVRRIPILH